MNYKLPIVSMALVALVIAAAVRAQLPQTISGKEVEPSAPTSVADAGQPEAPPAVDGNQLVAQAAHKLLSTPGIEAKARQSVDIFGQRLVGSGHYIQMPHSASPMFRLELKMQVGDGAITLQQIADGNTFWIRRVQADGNVNLSRVSLRRLRKLASEEDRPTPPAMWLALGGLPKLMQSMVQYFDFGPATPIVVRQLPLWKVEGTWKPEALAQLLAAEGDQTPAVQPDQLPDQLPHGVTLILGRDKVTPLFPYGVFYFREKQPAEGQNRVTRRGLVSLELFEVRLRPDLLPRHFQYVPGDQEVEERTDEYMARLLH